MNSRLAGVQNRSLPRRAYSSSSSLSRKYELKGYRYRRMMMILGITFSMFLIVALTTDNAPRSVFRTEVEATTNEQVKSTTSNEQLQSKTQDYIDRLKTTSYDYPVGYIRKPRLRPDGKSNCDDGLLHIIFSSGCNYYQHWQSELLLASAFSVGQRGRITRIVSGCHQKHAENVKHQHQTFPQGRNDLITPLFKLNRSVNENFGLFITPPFDGAVDFPWINKPSSIEYFMTEAREEIDRLGETVIAILDPDFIFLKPLTQCGTDPSDILVTRYQSRHPVVGSPADIVVKGRPVAQRYGLEGHWVTKFDVANITGNADSPAAKYTVSDARHFTSVGPPMMLHVDDLAELSKYWSKYMIPVLKVETDILADMHAYSIASAHLGLKHTTLDHYMISSAGSSGQAYPWVNAWESMNCQAPRPGLNDKYPVFIHMAANFKAPDRRHGPWMFHKGHVPADILECDIPRILPPPADVFNVVPKEDYKTRQTAWMLCHVIDRLNHMLKLYKDKFCSGEYENRKLVQLIQIKSVDRECRRRLHKWCWPLAQISPQEMAKLENAPEHNEAKDWKLAQWRDVVSS